MALCVRKNIKKCSYYVWYLGAREAEGVDEMPDAITYLLERGRLQEPLKVTLQMSSKGLKITRVVLHPNGSTMSAVKHIIPGDSVLATYRKRDIVAVTLLELSPASNNPLHVHAYRCDTPGTAYLLGLQMKALASDPDNVARVASVEGRIRSNLGSDGRSTRESESSEGSGELRHDPVQTKTIYESLAAELRAKLGRGNSRDNDVGPILLPPRDYDTVHRHRGNLAVTELTRCLNKTIVGGSCHPLGPRPFRSTRDSSSDDEWSWPPEETDYIPETESAATNLTLPRLPSSPERLPNQLNRGVSPGCNRNRRAPESRQRSPSPQYEPRVSPDEVTSPRERFQDAKEMFRAMEREAISPVHRVESARQSRDVVLERNEDISYRARPRPRTQHYSVERPPEPEVCRPRPKSFYDNHPSSREFREQRKMVDPRDVRDFRERAHMRELREKVRAGASTYQELSEHERYPGLDRESARPPLEICPTPGRFRHSYAEPPRLGLAALHPY